MVSKCTGHGIELLCTDSRCWMNEILMLVEVAREVTETPNEQQMVITGDILVKTQASHWSVPVYSRLWLVLSRWFPKYILPLETSVAWWPHVFIFGARVFVTRWWGRQMVRGDRQVHDHMVGNSRVLSVRCRSRPCLDQAILRSAKFTPRWNKTKYFRLRQSYEVRRSES